MGWTQATPFRKQLRTLLAVCSFIVYVIALWRDEFTVVYEFPFVSFLLFLWFSSLIVISRYLEWGRKLFIVTSFLICVYLLFSIRNNDYASMSLIFILCGLMIYYILPQVKMEFHSPAENTTNSIKKKILVVDDDKGLLKMIRSSLMHHGMEVITADSGEKGLSLAFQKKPDLIILDVILPGVKGRQVCVKLKEHPVTRDIPVMFLTAKDSPDDVRAEMAAGAVTHLTKPVDFKKLVLEIENILNL